MQNAKPKAHLFAVVFFLFCGLKVRVGRRVGEAGTREKR